MMSQEYIDRLDGMDKIRRIINNGAKCEYTYTHFKFVDKKLEYWDDFRPLTQAEALGFLWETSEKAPDGYRFSTGRCCLKGFGFGSVGVFIDSDDKLIVRFSEADRKPTPQEQFDVHDGIKNPEDVTPRTKYCHVEHPSPGFYAVCIRRPMTEEVRRCTEKWEAESICAKIDAAIQAAAQDMATYEAIEQVMQNLHLVI